MKTSTVRVVKAFEYEGRVYQAGEMVTMPPVYALAHSRKGHVSLTRLQNRQMVAQPNPPQPVSVDGRRSRRRQKLEGTVVREAGARRPYQRRDLTTKDPE